MSHDRGGEAGSPLAAATNPASGRNPARLSPPSAASDLPITMIPTIASIWSALVSAAAARAIGTPARGAVGSKK
jgi:hypothetical protein